MFRHLTDAAESYLEIGERDQTKQCVEMMEKITGNARLKAREMKRKPNRIVLQRQRTTRMVLQRQRTTRMVAEQQGVNTDADPPESGTNEFKTSIRNKNRKKACCI